MLKYDYKIPIQYAKKININGLFYKVRSFVVTNMDDVEKQFGEIIEVIVENNEVYFLINPLTPKCTRSCLHV